MSVIIATSILAFLLLTGILYYCKNDIEIKKGFAKNFFLYDNNKLIFSLKGKINIMAIKMTNSQIAKYQLTFVDKKGDVTDATSVEVSLTPESTGTISYDDPTNTVTIVAGSAGVGTIAITPKNSKGDVLPFDQEALEVTSGDAVSGSRSDVVLTEQE